MCVYVYNICNLDKEIRRSLKRVNPQIQYRDNINLYKCLMYRCKIIQYNYYAMHRKTRIIIHYYDISITRLVDYNNYFIILL